MRAELLHKIARRDGLHLFVFSRQEFPGDSWFFSLCEVVSELGPVAILDFANLLNLDNTANISILDANIDQFKIDHVTEQVKHVATGVFNFPQELSSERERFLKSNLLKIKEACANLLIILPEQNHDLERILTPKASSIVVSNVLMSQYVNSSIKRRLLEVGEPRETGEKIIEFRKLFILEQNQPSRFLLLFQRIWWLLALILCASILFIPDTWNELPLKNLDIPKELAQLSSQEGYAITFTGEISIFRAARHAIGRLTARVASDKEILSYATETIKRNQLDTTKWKRDAKSLIPDSGLTIRFFPPSDSQLSRIDSLVRPWGFFVSMMSDSLSYVTEYYDEIGTKAGRRHLGVDVAGRHGTRILAPFSGKAWTTFDERGGEVIALVNKEHVLLFMHCDQILYLDGQDVLPGDPLATVGMTGHTTGPHVHLVAGIVDKKGRKSIGTVRYNPIDPSIWATKYLSK